MTVRTERGKVTILGNTEKIETLDPLWTNELVSEDPSVFTGVFDTSASEGHLFLINNDTQNTKYIPALYRIIKSLPYGMQMFQNISELSAVGTASVAAEGSVVFFVGKKERGSGYVVVEVINDEEVTLLEVDNPQDYIYLQNWPLEA